MDIVELLRPKGAMVSIKFPGGAEYVFPGSVPVRVPREVAVQCMSRNVPGQRPMFSAEWGDDDKDADVDAVFRVEFPAWRSRSQPQ